MWGATNPPGRWAGSLLGRQPPTRRLGLLDPGRNDRRTRATQPVASRILIVKISESPGLIPAAGFPSG
jgi:hypothetical protein